MRKLLLMLMITAPVTGIMAQKDVKYEKIFYKDSKIESNDVIISVLDAVSTEGGTKFKLKIENKTNDYMIYKPEESKFTISGKDYKPTEEWEIVEPNDYGTIVINLKGTGFNAVKDYTFIMDGLYKVSANEKGIPVPDFKLPPSQNDFKAGNFNCTMTKLKKETDKTDVNFTATYNGDKIGILFPAKISVKMPDGNEFANSASKREKKAVLMIKGKKKNFSAEWSRMEGGKQMDMQKNEMTVKFNDAFTEVTPTKMKSETLELVFDEVTSNEKGKK